MQQQLGAWPSLGGMTLPTFSSELPIPAVDASSLLSGAQAGVTGSGASVVQSGSSQLSILTRLPRRLCERIAALEFVEMNELLSTRDVVGGFSGGYRGIQASVQEIAGNRHCGVDGMLRTDGVGVSGEVPK